MTSTAPGFPDAAGPASQQGMRRANLALVLGAVGRLGEASRAQLADSTGLTRAAVGNLVNDLIGAGLVVERGISLGGRVGRPSTALTLNDRGPAGLGLEIGVEHVGACVVDMRHEVRARIRRSAANRGRKPEEAAAQMAVVAMQAVRGAAESGLEPVGIAVAVPGLVARGDCPSTDARETGTVVHAPNLGWRDVDLAGMLGTLLPGALHALPISVDNEANLGALAELWLGSVGRDFVHVSTEAGIGAALVVDGLLLRGRRGFAGELGHVPVHPDGPPCACGSHGCLEQYAGEEAVLRRCGMQDAAGDRITLLAAEANAGHGEVRRALDEAGRALGIALAGAVNLVDPETVVLGGTYAELAEWLVPGMQAELEARVRIRPWNAADLVVSTLRREGAVTGAAATVVQRLMADPGSAV